MDKKKSLQLSLVILLILSSIIFYKKFFDRDLVSIEKKVNENKFNTSDLNKKTENSSVTYYLSSIVLLLADV